MRFSVDAHSVGCHLTGNQVYIRNLLNEFARIDRSNEFIAYVAKPAGAIQFAAGASKPVGFRQNPYRRLALDLPASVRRDRPDLLHVQYTGPARPQPNQ